MGRLNQPHTTGVLLTKRAGPTKYSQGNSKQISVDLDETKLP